MEKEIYSKETNGTEYKLVLEYDNRFDPTTQDLSEVGDLSAGIGVMEFPDRVFLSIKAQGFEQTLSLTGEAYKELRELLHKDMGSGHYVLGGVRPRRRG